ncbi:hypothetical protein [Schlesneria paludicola]|uniref:hypothetical protein n=1 Tax=Schlesneria paludicola TaxID=360056 RepID=UPI0012FC69D8|nr:hypothetical protein [Schlesneria paludicola]
MRQISRFRFTVFVTCVTASFSTVLLAQNGKSPQRQSSPPATSGKSSTGRPSSAPPKGAAAEAPAKIDRNLVRQTAATDELPPELEEILADWEAHSKSIKTLHGIQSRSEFNHVFGVEKVTKGPFFLETPDKGRIDILAVKLGKGAVSNKLDKEKKPYKLESGQSQKWICTGEEILILNEDEKDKTYSREAIPENQRGKNIIHSPLPFLFGMEAEEAKHRFKLQFDKDKTDGSIKNSKDSATLLAWPKMEKDRQNYKVARITLDKTKYLPKEVRLLDDSGTEVVYTFESVSVNTKNLQGVRGIFGIETDPYHPSLKGYALYIPPEDPIEEREKRMGIPVQKSGQKVRMATPVEPSAPPTKDGKRSATAPQNSIRK